MAQQEYKLEPLKIWPKAKELRMQFYKSFLEAKEKGGIRYAGGAVTFHALTSGLGRDVYNLSGEPYGATCAANESFAIAAQEACDRAGIARDLCSYLRNYWGSILLDKFVFVDGTVLSGWPAVDFFFTIHLCCSHAKWYQYASELEGNVPIYAVDIGVLDFGDVKDERFQRAVKYATEQANEAIPWMEKVTGRKFDDELFCEAAENEIASRSLWAQILSYNQVIPAPLEEKTAFSLYVFDTLCPHWKSTVDFYKELRDEIQDRVNRGIGAIYPENFRLVTDSQPPWTFLEIFRFLGKEYGAVSVGSLYIIAFASWQLADDGALVPTKTLDEEGIDLRSMSREEAVKTYVEHVLGGFAAGVMFQTPIKSKIMKQICKQWKAQAVLMHLNRGCEGAAMGQMQNKLELAKAGIPVFTYEGNMGDPRDFDIAKTKDRLETFMENAGVKRISLAGS